MVFWDDLGFPTNYEVETDIEYPGDGVWVELRFGDGSDSDWAIARISPLGAEPWLLSRAADDLYGTPDPNVVCVFSRFDEVTMVNVYAPDRAIVVDVMVPLSICLVPDLNFFVVATDRDLTAVDTTGQILWRSELLFSDDLRVRRTDNARIVCRGWNYYDESQTELTVDAATGNVLTGVSYAQWSR